MRSQYKTVRGAAFRQSLYFLKGERKMSEILYLDKNAVVIYKPTGIPTQPDPTGSVDAMTALSDRLSSDGESAELYLIHRLDRVAEGLLVFARNKKSAGELSRMAAEQQLGKEYLAVVSGDAPGGSMTDLLYKDARQGKSFVTDRERAGVKRAELEYECVARRDGLSLVRIRLKTGRFHQIRAQFSSRGMPLVGDGKYGSRDKGARFPALASHRLDFELMGKRVFATRMPNITEYPWRIFADEINFLGGIYD